MSKPVCVVTGVGPEHGTGAEIARRFAEGGYQVAMLARNGERLRNLESKYANSKAYICDVGDLDALISTMDAIKRDLGDPEVVIHNAPRATHGSILEVPPESLEDNFRVNTTALLHLARETAPAMLKAGKGAIMVTGNTSATRGKANFLPQPKRPNAFWLNPWRGSLGRKASTLPISSSMHRLTRHGHGQPGRRTSRMTSSRSPAPSRTKFIT